MLSENGPALLRGLEILVGAYYFLFGVNGFYPFIPLPKPSERGLSFLQSIDATRYIFPFVKVTEILVGLMWILGWQTPSAWLIFTPIWINILCYQILFNKKEGTLAALIFSAHVLLGYKYLPIFSALWRLSGSN